jgi:hypothetical protein
VTIHCRRAEIRQRSLSGGVGTGVNRAAEPRVRMILLRGLQRA